MPVKKQSGYAAKNKIIRFFSINPASVDTLRGIITWNGLNKNEAVRALEELTREGILTPHRATSTVGYAYAPGSKNAKKIKKYLMAEGERSNP